MLALIVLTLVVLVLFVRAMRWALHEDRSAHDQFKDFSAEVERWLKKVGLGD